MITVHVIVKNEENFIWFAIKSVIPYVDRILIYDTGSVDKTTEIIKSINSTKIELEEKGVVTSQELTNLRNQQIEKTSTDWFMLLDGDEVWSVNSLKGLIDATKTAKAGVMGIVVRTRNCVGDIFHYLPESRGEYRLLGKKGHYNIRAFRKSEGYKWVGKYPLESYNGPTGAINNAEYKLMFLDKYYWHTTHLRRTCANDSSKRAKRKIELGIEANKEEIPEVFFYNRPSFVPDPLKKQPLSEKMISYLTTPLKEIKSKL